MTARAQPSWAVAPTGEASLPQLTQFLLAKMKKMLLHVCFLIASYRVLLFGYYIFYFLHFWHLNAIIYIGMRGLFFSRESVDGTLCVKRLS